MMSMTPRPPIPAERFLRSSRTEGYELIDGRPLRKVGGAESSWIQTGIQGRLGEFVVAARLGFVLGSGCPYRCFPDRPDHILKPDVSFVRSGRFPGDAPPRGAAEIAPDFVAEVVSPWDRAERLADKIADFESVGVPLIWVVYPNRRLVQVRQQGSVIRELTLADVLTGDPVLPGFRVRVADLFPQPPAQP
jgi:Uma2 family endonuclease